MIELFTLYKLFGCLVNLSENIPDSRLETCIEIILQLKYVSCPIVDVTEKMSLIIKR